MSTYYPTITEQLKTLPIYLSSTGIFFDETMINRQEGYSDYQWIITVTGQGELLVGDETYQLDSSTGVFIPPHIPHSYRKTSDSWVTHWITFNGDHLKDIFQLINLNSIELVYLKDSTGYLRDLENIFYLASSNYPKYAFKISTLLYSIIEHLSTLQQSSEYHTLDNKSNLINITLEYIDQYYMMELTINELAKFSHISPQYLCRLFKDRLNLRPFEYINQVRINKSKSMLLKTPTPKIFDVSNGVGFANPSYYTSIFKKYEKITPREFIKLHQRGV